jgi:hypothetical protein
MIYGTNDAGGTYRIELDAAVNAPFGNNGYF